MAFCTKCGKEIPDGMNFCDACGTPIDPSVASAPENKKKKARLIPAIIAAAVLIIAAACILFFIKTADSPEEAITISPIYTEETEETTVTTEENSAVDIDALLASYQKIVDDVIDQCSEASRDTQKKNCGNLGDYDNDGCPEMVMLYSPDDVRLIGMIARYDGNPDKPATMEIEICELNDTIDATIVSGLHGDVPVVNLFYSDWEGDNQVGADNMISLADGGMEPYATMEWETAADGLLLSSLVTDIDGNTDDSEEAFFDYYYSFDFLEAQYSDDEAGITLSEMFTDESMANYKW